MGAVDPDGSDSVRTKSMSFNWVRYVGQFDALSPLCRGPPFLRGAVRIRTCRVLFWTPGHAPATGAANEIGKLAIGA